MLSGLNSRNNKKSCRGRLNIPRNMNLICMITCPSITINFNVSLILERIRATPTSWFGIAFCTIKVEWFTYIRCQKQLTTVNNYRSHNTVFVDLTHQLIVTKCLMRQSLLIFLCPRSVIFPQNLEWIFKNTMYLSLKYKIQICIPLEVKLNPFQSTGNIKIKTKTIKNDIFQW